MSWCYDGWGTGSVDEKKKTFTGMLTFKVIPLKDGVEHIIPFCIHMITHGSVWMCVCQKRTEQDLKEYFQILFG